MGRCLKTSKPSVQNKTSKTKNDVKSKKLCINKSKVKTTVKTTTKTKAKTKVKDVKITVNEMRDQISKLAVDETTPGMKCITLAELDNLTDIKDNILKKINKSKKMIVLTGAGISCNAGIPDFRSNNGLYNQKLETESNNNNNKEITTTQQQKTVIGKEMFDISVYRSIDTVKIFNKFMFNLYQSVNQGKYTKTHQFIKGLNDKKKLIKCYTQNIDGLERNCGLRTEFECNEWKNIDVIQLHGDLHQLCCNSCKQNFKWDEIYDNEGKSKIIREYEEEIEEKFTNDDDLMILSQDSSNSNNSDNSESIFSNDSDGEDIIINEEVEINNNNNNNNHGIVECPKCVQKYERKIQMGKRSLESSIGIIRPNIVLYGEEHPFSETFGKNLNKDLNRKPNILLIFGTSLKVSGVKMLVRKLSKKVHEQDNGIVILVNKEPVSKSSWGKVIDYQIISDCDAFCDFVEGVKN